MATYVIEGSRVTDIASFYSELDRLVMADEDWTLGASLDALDDLLYGGIGALVGDHAVVFEWADSEQSRDALGVEATAAWLRGKLDRPDMFSIALLRAQLADLEAGLGKTYFELILDVFADHPAVTLVLR
ncbi:barstar family protein [Microbacterium dauci]|uniref:Ribonuclease inhibitor n=1 Tax=Microbacterium dauci TaxID=3048008 RepID=A0ABT6ZD85_9MICO|nr:ribonuclease inhibitor [Microbacterium sp. LX3-4]MDJ1114113.1 ribonuclease inhibitor [Microbacterium sp. LX3-4]